MMNDGPIEFGEPAPAFVAATMERDDFPFNHLAGRPVALLFVAGLGGDAGAELRMAIEPALVASIADKYRLFVVSAQDGDRDCPNLSNSYFHGRVFFDGKGLVREAFKLPVIPDRQAVLYCLDTMLRVERVLHLKSPESLCAALNEWIVKASDQKTSHRIESSAPVLEIDKVFEPLFCTQLMEQFEADGGSPSGYMVPDGERTLGRRDARVKRRRDLYLDRTGLVEKVRERLVTRLMPVIRQAFQFRVTRIERYLVARYDADDQGYFRPHRDDDTVGTAHRKFGLSINLNENYQGGELGFPEFGQALYRPKAGSAAIFSCKLLHEARPVTEGTRYVFLSFLFDEAGYEVLRRNRGSVSEATNLKDSPA